MKYGLVARQIEQVECLHHDLIAEEEHRESQQDSKYGIHRICAQLTGRELSDALLGLLYAKLSWGVPRVDDGYRKDSSDKGSISA